MAEPTALRRYKEPCLISRRPLVVLAGWLGCKERNLNRYASLYNDFGFAVVTRIASPAAVTSAAVSKTELVTSHLKLNGRSRDQMTMLELAWDTVLVLSASQCPAWIFHCFSNSGCFLWEHIRDILTASNENSVKLEPKIHHQLVAVKRGLVGVVFDSGPAKYDILGISAAMQYTAIMDRIKYRTRKFLRNISEDKVETRSSQFFQGMRNDQSNSPQLYFYSRSDGLNPFEPLDELVKHRQRAMGTHRIQSRKWESSRHCSHLLEHPDEYRVSLEEFLNQCLQGTTTVFETPVKPRL